MALSTCRDCNREVSTLARHCVHCGRPRPTASGSGSVIAGVAVVVIALALTAGVVCAARKACRQVSNRAWAECRTEKMSNCSTRIVAPAPAAEAASPESIRLVLEERGARILEFDRTKGVMTVEIPMKVGK